MRKPEPNTRALRDEALHLQLSLDAGCICGRLAPQSRPCDNTRAAEMIGRLIATLQADAKTLDLIQHRRSIKEQL